ncbi:MAG: glutamyl-tRNA reductase [Thermoanaerobaculia bacterium]
MTTTAIDPQLMRPRDEMPPLLLIGVDHRSAPLAVREKVAYGAEEVRTLLRRVTASMAIEEACLLTTCNRTELYLLADDESAAYRRGLLQVFAERAPEIELEGRFYVKRRGPAARHLLEVASGLRSMILGEPEILGQVKRAGKLAAEVGVDGRVLRRLLRTAVAAGGRARSETAIGTGAVSFGYAVAELARNLFDTLENSSVLLVGAGETARQVARSLRERGAGELRVANRSRERADKLRSSFPDARTVAFEDRVEAAAGCDVIVTSTSADTPVFSRRELRDLTRARVDRPLLVADLGVPRNVDPAAAGLEGLFLHDVDSLEELIAGNLEQRRKEVPRVHEILDRELARFDAWYRGRAAEPLIAQLQRWAESIRQLELGGVRDRFPADTHAQLDQLTRSLVRKLLHHPSSRLADLDASDLEKLEWVRELFRLDEE